MATVYGPFYYLYEWCALSLAGVRAASDSLRLVSVTFWVAAALIAFVLVYRATGSLLLAMCVHLLVFRALGFIGEEPAHPQEACIFLLLALGRAFYIANRTLRMVMMGALGGAMVASKINLGNFCPRRAQPWASPTRNRPDGGAAPPVLPYRSARLRFRQC